MLENKTVVGQVSVSPIAVRYILILLLYKENSWGRNGMDKGNQEGDVPPTRAHQSLMSLAHTPDNSIIAGGKDNRQDCLLTHKLFSILEGCTGSPGDGFCLESH